MADTEHFFTFGDANRSERGIQADLLVPALASKASRRYLLSLVPTASAPPISDDEADLARVWHFVWVLRDTFSAERDAAQETRAWKELSSRWVALLGLPPWATEHSWWRHPEGKFANDPDFVVHPCQRSVGWTSEGIRRRVARFGLAGSPEVEAALTTARQTMNTECDCLIQTPNRLIVIECKDKTEFVKEQEVRQSRLFECLQRTLARPESLVFVELGSGPPGVRPRQPWSWDTIRAALCAERGA